MRVGRIVFLKFNHLFVSEKNFSSQFRKQKNSHFSSTIKLNSGVKKKLFPIGKWGARELQKIGTTFHKGLQNKSRN